MQLGMEQGSVCSAPLHISAKLDVESFHEEAASKEQWCRHRRRHGRPCKALQKSKSIGFSGLDLLGRLGQGTCTASEGWDLGRELQRALLFPCSRCSSRLHVPIPSFSLTQLECNSDFVTWDFINLLAGTMGRVPYRTAPCPWELSNNKSRHRFHQAVKWDGKWCSDFPA